MHSHQQMKLILSLSLMLLMASANAGEDGLSDFVIGKYLLFGQSMDANATYSGKIDIYRKNSKLKVQRQIEGVITKGDASLETALNGDASVLRIRFSKDAQKYEETCLIHSDLDNYARITCYLYKPGVKTNNPDMEAFFIDHNAK